MSSGEYKRYTEEQIARANGTDIYSLAKYRGYEVRDKNKNGKLAEIRHQNGMDLDRTNNKWYCHSTRIGGGPIQLLMYMENMTWLEAVKNILNEDGQIEMFKPDREIQVEKQNKEFNLPIANRSCHHVFAYLIKSRCIHPDIVQYFVHKKLLYENDRHSCVFVGCDKDNNPRYAMIRGTNTMGAAFKGESRNSDKRFGFAKVGSNHILTLTEAPIDVLSYMTIFKLHGREDKIKDEHILSLGGVSDVALEQYLCDHPEITDIQLGLDNDDAGNSACQKITEKYSDKYNIRRIQMKQKDMNEVLKADIQNIIARHEELINQEKQGEELAID